MTLVLAAVTIVAMLAVFLATTPLRAAAQVHQGDKTALIAFYNSAGGSGWTNNTNWNTSAALDTWYGVTTNSSGRVTGLNLPRNGLSGTIDAAIGNLTELDYLGLADNNLRKTQDGLGGSIPTEVGDLTKLVALDLSYNNLSGSIPSLRNLTALKTLRLTSNSLTGEIPNDLSPQYMHSLMLINLSGNQLSGHIKNGLFLGSGPSNQSDLRAVFLAANNLTNAPSNEGRWAIPTYMRYSPKLRFFSAAGNQLTGDSWYWIADATNLRAIDLSDNDLTYRSSSQYESLKNLTRLTDLDLSHNSLSGSYVLNDIFRALPSLERLDLAGNQISGIIPWIGNLRKLEYLDLSDRSGGRWPSDDIRDPDTGNGNNLSGPLPISISSLGNLYAINVNGNDQTSSNPLCLPQQLSSWSLAQQVYRQGVKDCGRSLAVNAVTNSTARLTLWGHTGNWWLSRTGSNDCSSRGSNYVANLSNLNSSTSYTYTAYSDSSCAMPMTGGVTFTTTSGAPALTPSNIVENAATVTLTNYTGDWWLKRTAPTSGGCAPQASSNYAVNLTNLSPGTDYTYGAYSDRTCTTLIVSGSFSTPKLEASFYTNTAAQLVLSDYSGSWWLERTTPSGGTCTSQGTSYTVSLSDLTASTSYTYAAYSDSACTTSFADVTFTTKASAPSLSSSYVVNDAARLTLTNYGGSWWLERTTPSGGTCTSQGTSYTVSLSDLSASTSYTYGAYSDSTCDDEITTVSFTTYASAPSLAAIAYHNPYYNWVQFRLSNWDEAWWIKMTSPSASDCRSAGSSATYVFHYDFDAAASYTMNAYSDSSCSTSLGSSGSFQPDRLTGRTQPFASMGPQWPDDPPDQSPHDPPDQSPGVLPEAPAGLSAAAGDRSVTLSWSEPADLSIMRYEYQVRWAGVAWGEWTAIADSDSSTTSFSLGGLDNGTEYRFHVRAVNPVGASKAAPLAHPWYVAATPEAPLVLPGVPSGLSAAAGDGGVTLSWSDPSDSSITGYEYQVRWAGVAWGEWTAIAGSGSGTTSHTVDGLDNGTEYRFHVRAVNPVGASKAAPLVHPWYVAATPQA